MFERVLWDLKEPLQTTVSIISITEPDLEYWNSDPGNLITRPNFVSESLWNHWLHNIYFTCILNILTKSRMEYYRDCNGLWHGDFHQILQTFSEHLFFRCNLHSCFSHAMRFMQTKLILKTHQSMVHSLRNQLTDLKLQMNWLVFIWH